MPIRVGEAMAPYMAQLRGLPFVDRVRSVRRPDRAGARARADFELELSLPDGDAVTFLVELKTSHLSAHAADQIRVMQRPGERWLLAAPYIGAPLGEALAARGINYIDRQGNCYLRIDDRHVARTEGRKPPRRPARKKELRAPGYQVMFALLAQPDLVRASSREIAAAAGTSRQPVADLLARFAEERIVVRRGRSHEWAEPPGAALLDRWVEGYRGTLRPRLEVGRYRVPARTPPEVEAWLGERIGGVRYGGTAGAHRLVAHYRGPLTVAHLGPPSEPTRKRLRALPAAAGDLVWMRHIGEMSSRGATPDTVHPLLIYAELATDPDPRAGEVAIILRERWLPWSL
jgi:hypothetical protein